MNLDAWMASPAWTAAGWTMMHMAWAGALIGLASAAARSLLRPARPEARYAVAVAAFLALAVAPAVIFATIYEPPAKPTAVATRPATPGPRTPPAEVEWTPNPWHADAPPASPSRPPISALGRLARLLPWAWLGGSLPTLAWLVAGLAGVERLRRSSRPIDSGTIPGRCRALADSLGIARRVGLAACDRLAAPVLVGIVRPLILLPPAALSGWSMDQVEMALLHELAHLRRRDNLVNLLQRVVESAWFFHPAAWWLSGWVRLERESCCDALVVGRTGHARAYAEMLAGLAGSGRGGRLAVLGMADRQVTTRIRRILDMEDGSMRLTMPEGFGLVGAALVAAVLAAASHAAEPAAAPRPDDDATRSALRAMAAEVAAAPIKPSKLNDADRKGDALAAIAEAQLKLGDRDAALGTLRTAFDALADAKPRLEDLGRLEGLIKIAEVQAKAGDRAAALASLDRLERTVVGFESAPPDFKKLNGDQPGGAAPEGPPPGMLAIGEPFLNTAFVLELSAGVAEARLDLGDRDGARATIARMQRAARSFIVPARPIMLGTVGVYFARAGDLPAAREMVDQARRSADSMVFTAVRRKTQVYVARFLAEIGDLDQALTLAKSLDAAHRALALRMVAESVDRGHTRGPLYQPAALWIETGAERRTIADPAAARLLLPKVAEAVRESCDAKAAARTMAMIAHLQAMAGDFAGALATIAAMPELRRANFPGPADGFYEAVKPYALSAVARSQAEAGGKADRAASPMAGVRPALREALALAVAIGDDGQRAVARVGVIANMAGAGEPDLARAAIRDALPDILAGPEPRRSRCLARLSSISLELGDVHEAMAAVERIGPDRPLEAAYPRNALAAFLEKVGDRDEALHLYRRSLAELEAPPRQPVVLPKGRRQIAIPADAFQDPDAEIDPALLQFYRGQQVDVAKDRLGDPASALATARSRPAGPMRVNALANLVAADARRGDVAGSLAKARALDTPEERVAAAEMTAIAIRDRAAVK